MKLRNKPKQGMPLDTYVALGGNPKNYKGAKGNVSRAKPKK
jgi:hypothetical protein